MTSEKCLTLKKGKVKEDLEANRLELNSPGNTYNSAQGFIDMKSSPRITGMLPSPFLPFVISLESIREEAICCKEDPRNNSLQGPSRIAGL